MRPIPHSTQMLHASSFRKDVLHLSIQAHLHHIDHRALVLWLFPLSLRELYFIRFAFTSTKTISNIFTGDVEHQ
jgi:hypothetical protein